MSAPRSLDKSRDAPPLVHLGPQWFAPVMGWSGLALAWHRAEERFGPAAEAVALGCGLVALSAFLVVLAASALRAARHPRALAEDLSHPVRHAFVAALPVSLLLLASLGVALYGPGSALATLWLAGVALQACVTGWVVSRWFSGRLQWPAVTPVLYIPIVGNILVPLAGAPLGWPAMSWFFFAIGAFFWPVVTAMVLVRKVQQPLPDRLQATWFITIAPPAVAGTAAVALGAPEMVLSAALGVAAVFAFASATRVPTIARQQFAMPAWAVSFPLAALTALALRAADTVAPALAMPAVLLLAVTSVVLVGLSLATVKGLRAGTLLAPEPVATISVAPGPSK
ncbi:MAG TPA: C4-dicarboxylate ABC transporter [Quisquiliibacterium sp.]|jgi:tellurite resistance protein|nr:C4-dicarboxylate ABC transporter [Quisquiliibacterium sp.]